MQFLKYKGIKAEIIRDFLSRSLCYYGNLLCHENNTNMFSSDWAVFDTIIAALIDKEW